MRQKSWKFIKTISYILLLVIIINFNIGKFIYVHAEDLEIKREIFLDNLNNSQDLLNYQVSVIINTSEMITSDRLNKYCTNINFKDSDELVEIPFWIENCNSIQTKVWLKVPIIRANSSNKVYMNYGYTSEIIIPKYSPTDIFARAIPNLETSFTFEDGTIKPYMLNSSTVTDFSAANRSADLRGTKIVKGKYNNGIEFVERDDLCFYGTWCPNEHMWSRELKATVTKNFSYDFWVYPKKNIQSGLNQGDWAGTWGQSYVYFPYGGDNVSPNGCSPTNVGTGISVGMNGITVVAHGPCYIVNQLGYSVKLSGWNHIAIVVKDNTPSLYLNGVFIKEGIPTPWFTFPSNILGDSSMNSGPWSDYGPFQGILDETRIYSKVLTSEEVKDLYYNKGYSTINYPGTLFIIKSSENEPKVLQKETTLSITLPEKEASGINSSETSIMFSVETLMPKRDLNSSYDNLLQIRLDDQTIIPLYFSGEDGEYTIWKGEYKIPAGSSSNISSLSGVLEISEFNVSTQTLTNFTNLPAGFNNSGTKMNFIIDENKGGKYYFDTLTPLKESITKQTQVILGVNNIKSTSSQDSNIITQNSSSTNTIIILYSCSLFLFLIFLTIRRKYRSKLI